MKVTLGDHDQLNPDLDRLHMVYADLGVDVVRIKSSTTDSVFLRDAVAWTPRGLISCRMKHRIDEPKQYLSSDIGRYPIHYLPSGIFEGADLLWVFGRDTIPVLAVGNRTDYEGAFHVIKILNRRVNVVELPNWHKQHLLGLVNCVDSRLFAYQVMSDQLLHDVVILPDEDYLTKGANWVQVENTVVINDACLATARLLEKYVEVKMVSLQRLLACGGGPACATGTLEP